MQHLADWFDEDDTPFASKRIRYELAATNEFEQRFDFTV